MGYPPEIRKFTGLSRPTPPPPPANPKTTQLSVAHPRPAPPLPPPPPPPRPPCPESRSGLNVRAHVPATHASRMDRSHFGRDVQRQIGGINPSRAPRRDRPQAGASL